MNSYDTEGDDLTLIRGIGPARQEWLRESLNVCTLQDLATLSVDEIEAQLKTEGRAVPRNEIKEWIAQARDHAGIYLPSQPVADRAVESGMTANPPAADDGWRPLASFVVEFQVRQAAGEAAEKRTTVHYMEADKTKEWPGIEGEQLHQWMLDQVGGRLHRRLEEEADVEELNAAVEEAKLPAKLEPVPAVPATVAISQLRTFQPPEASQPSAVGEAGQPFQGFVGTDAAFAIEARFELAGPAALEAAKEQRTYRAQFYAHDPTTRVTAHLGTTPPDALVEGKTAYAAVLRGAVLPTGSYRLYAVVTVQSTPPVLGYLEVPLLQVV